MADVFDFYVQDNRKITFEIAEPIMREDSGVTDFVFHIPKVLNELEVSDWAWWLVFVNANKAKYSIALTLSDDPESPLEKNVATYTVDYAMSIKAGSVQFALEAINAGTGGAIDNEWHTQSYEIKVKETLQGNQAEYAETESDIISALLEEVRTKVNSLVGGATPEVKDSIAEMTDHKKIYVLSTDGNWYRYNGTAWVSGGQYASGITIDPTLTQSGQAADAKVVGDEIVTKVSKPVSSPNGTAGQLLRTNGDGTTQWVDQGLPTDAQTAEAVSGWLDNHPEATTTVQDGAITEPKLADTLKLKTIKDYVTPKMFGAKGDGVTDDTDAIKNALAANTTVYFPAGTYNVVFADAVTQKQILFPLNSNQTILFDKDAIINIVGNEYASLSAVFGFADFPVSNVMIDGATIQCESVHTTNPMGIRFETAFDAEAEQITNVSISNCVFKNLDSAVYIVQRRTTGVETRQTKNVLISNCKGYSCLSSFVTADGENITIQNCFADGENNAGAYDAVSVHSGINIKILNNVFKCYTLGQVINIRNSPENKCGTRNVLISGNTIADSPTQAIQISVTSGEATYGVTNVSVIGNRVYNCGTGIVITSGSATSGTPFKNFVVNSNIFESCNTSANLQANTTVWNERMTISNNIFANSGNFSLNAIRHCTFIGNYINLKTGAIFSANNLYYSDFSANIVWADNTEISFSNVVYAGIFSNFFKGIVKLENFSNADFCGNNCMNLLTINGTAGYNVKTDYRHGQIITYSNNHPTGTATAFHKGDMYINSDLSTDVYAWVCTESGSPGIWKAILLS